MSKNTSLDVCPIARSLSVLGDAWSMLILRDAHAGFTRFDQFRKSLGIAPTMLTKRLSVLVEEGLLEKRQYSEQISPVRRLSWHRQHRLLKAITNHRQANIS